MNKTLTEKIEEILPKESAHYYTDALLSLFEEMGNKVIKELENLKSPEYVQDVRSDRNTLIEYFMDKQRIKLKELLGKRYATKIKNFV